jgi:hypothetical protein
MTTPWARLPRRGGRPTSKGGIDPRFSPCGPSRVYTDGWSGYRLRVKGLRQSNNAIRRPVTWRVLIPFKAKFLPSNVNNSGPPSAVQNQVAQARTGQYFDPVAIRILDKGEALHAAIIRALDVVNPEGVEPLAGFVNIGY